MLRIPFLSPAVLAGTLLLGCDDAPTPSEPRTTQRGTSFRTASNPNGPGAVVVRVEGLGIGFADRIPNTEFSYFIGFTLEEFAEACAQEEFPGPPPGSVFEQVVLRPDGSIQHLFRAIRAPLLAWNVDLPTGFCSAPPFAVGTAQFIATDNDLTFSQRRTDAFGFVIHGTATALEGGQRYRLWQRLHVTALKTGEIVVATEEFKFFPIGQ
jgi:hypothetical protein